MKKVIALICMIACVFGLTACGEEVYSEYEQQKMAYAQELSAQKIVPILAGFMEADNATAFDGYTDKEIEYIFGQDYSLNVVGYGVLGAISSFRSAAETVGDIVAIGNVTATIDDDQIVVLVDIEGTIKNAQAEVIVSNDMFMSLESAALNPLSTTSEKMGQAGLDTLIGMGIVFVVLILISLLISCFVVIPKIQAMFTKKNEDDIKTESITKTIDQIAQHEDAILTNDYELVAVIAAAIAASEGATSTDGFVVRSIRKRIKSK